MSEELLEDLEELIEKWEWEYQTYINSDVELERTMSVQQYSDVTELQRIVDKHKD